MQNPVLSARWDMPPLLLHPIFLRTSPETLDCPLVVSSSWFVESWSLLIWQRRTFLLLGGLGEGERVSFQSNRVGANSGGTSRPSARKFCHAASRSCVK